MAGAGSAPIELGIGILLATGFFLAAGMTPLRVSVSLLLLLVPFQMVSVVDVTNNMAMAYMVAAGLYLGGARLKIPLMGSMLIVLLTYFLSISQVDHSLYRYHAVALIILVSGFVVFILAYNLARNVEDARYVVNLLVVGNLLILGYCMIQLVLGPGASAKVLGLEQLAVESNRGNGDPRLGGPFGGAPGILAEYLALVTVVLVYECLYSQRNRRTKLWLVIAANLGMLVATANRGGFITLVVGMGGLLFLNRKEIGTVRALQIAVGGASLLLVAAVAVTRLTGFDLLFSRLEEVTATQGGVPQTRALVWPEAWNRFLQVPWFGQGPTWRLPMEHLGATFPGHVYMDYPHSLYLYLLVTVGVAGFVAFGWFFLTLGRKLLYAARHVHYESPYVDGLVRLGPLLVGLFLMDQLRIEFLRPTFGDYQHFVFAFFGLWLGLAHRTPRLESAPEPAMSQAAPASLRPRRATVAARGGGHARNAS